MATLTISGLEQLLAGLDLVTPIPTCTDANPLNNPMDIYRSYVADIVQKAVGCERSVAFKSIQCPQNIYNGDLAIILPRLGPKDKANVLAFEIAEKVSSDLIHCGLFDFPIPDGVHLRIMFETSILSQIILPYINDRKVLYGQDLSLGSRDPSSPNSGRKKVVVEFSSPNIASDFQAKHLRSTILGAHIATMYETMGWEAIKINYLGDWGKPIGLLGIGWDKFGSEEAFATNPVGHLREVNYKVNELFKPVQAEYKKIRDEGGDTAEFEAQGLFAERNDFFTKMLNGSEKEISFWKRVRDVNIEHYTKLYSRLNVTFDEYSGESLVTAETMNEVESILKAKGLSEQDSSGSWIVDLKKHSNRSGAVVIRDRTGSTTYQLRDLAAILERSRKFNFDQMIFVVAKDHSTHFQRIKQVLELMGMSDLANKLLHVAFSDVSSMSEKFGEGDGLDEILDQCQTAMKESLETNPDKSLLLGQTPDLPTIMATNALLSQELSARRGTDHSFDIAKMTSFEPRTGPELQYWYTRLQSLLKEAPDSTDLSAEDIDSIDEDEFTDLARMLTQYPNITHAAYTSLEPAGILEYLFSLVDQLSKDDNKVRVSEEQKVTGITPAQAALYEATRVVLENGMRLLRITPAVI
ncbi:arginyl-tRNA synthetase [Microthyrium microscopicum]|uniref:arginine--tRNA ligase n=1 Tax=Microthyrium microscopicum TaxID=703497 RepID=A0A6A6U0R8_9PEZI|nr:arginyl-tRNA synthetase [Microthyrium microscopicum]